jgi:hypothetical protein
MRTHAQLAATIHGDQGPMSKVTVLLDEAEFDRLDSYCTDRGFKKSTLIARLIREHLARECFPNQQVLALLEERHPTNPPVVDKH